MTEEPERVSEKDPNFESTLKQYRIVEGEDLNKIHKMKKIEEEEVKTRDVDKNLEIDWSTVKRATIEVEARDKIGNLVMYQMINQRKKLLKVKTKSPKNPLCIMECIKQLNVGEEALFRCPKGTSSIPSMLDLRGIKAESYFRVKLVEVLKIKKIVNKTQKSKYSEVLERTMQIKKQAMDEFVDFNYEGASNLFQKSYRVLRGLSKGIKAALTEEEISKRKQLMVDLLNNAAFCLLKKQNYYSVIKLCESSLKIDPSNKKSRFRSAEAYLGIKDYKKAISIFRELKMPRKVKDCLNKESKAKSRFSKQYHQSVSLAYKSPKKTDLDSKTKPSTDLINIMGEDAMICPIEEDECFKLPIMDIPRPFFS